MLTQNEKVSLIISILKKMADHHELGRFVFSSEEADAEPLFTDNDTNGARHWGGEPRPAKDAFHARVVQGERAATRSDDTGTKSCFWLAREIPSGGELSLRFRLSREGASAAKVDTIVGARRAEADVFYERLASGVSDPERRRVMRQALAGMIWSKQFYYLDVRDWLHGDPGQPTPPEARTHGRNREWEHLNNADIVSMPDKWEYPWYAAWDLAFHTVALARVDLDFAKEQLVMLTREWYMHPNGQLPAYEWAFGDVNPPVHAWAAWKVYQHEKKARGKGDRAFLERVFHKLMLNFTWWVNRKDKEGRNIFQGGFLGLDNIGVFDRSAPLPTGGHIDQADGTAWVAAYSLQLMRIALELARDNPTYEDIATKFFEHFLHIAEAMTNVGGRGVGLWHEEDGFYYDVLHLDEPGGAERMVPLLVRSMVGLLPLVAVEVLEPDELAAVPGFAKRLEWFLAYRPDLARLVSRWQEQGKGQRTLLSLLRGSRMKKLLRRLLDETEFLAPHGIRALSKVHESSPYVLEHGASRFEVRYQPAESTSNLFGGNSNWRGPIWMPVNYLLVDSLREFHRYYGDDFRVECPVGSGVQLSLAEVADELSRRLVSLFLPDEHGIRPFLSATPELARDPHFKDHLLFHEYFHGDTGRGVGASHQTGWTGLVACLIADASDPKKEPLP